MRLWVSGLPRDLREALRLDIEHFWAAVPTSRQRRAYFDLFLWLGEDGEELDELLVLTHAAVCETNSGQSPRATS